MIVHTMALLAQDWGLAFLFETGRVAMPLFVFVLAYNLARPDALARGAYPRCMKRLALFGALATPPFVALGGLAVWCYCKSPSWAALLFAPLACAALWPVNGNFWALAAIPVVIAATRLDCACRACGGSSMRTTHCI